MQSTYSSDDRLMAALAHVGALVLPILLPVIIYFVKKDQSPWVGKQSMQALIYQGVEIVVSFIIFGLIVPIICGAITMGIGGLLGCLAPILYIAFAVYGCYGAYQVYQGVDFKYPYIYTMVNK
jgi:uncharacterized protein